MSSPSNLLPINRFSTMTGISIETLRRWDRENILKPANSPRAPREARRYSPSQIQEAKESKHRWHKRIAAELAAMKAQPEAAE